MNKQIIQIQIAWFFSNVYLGSFEKLSLKLKEKFGESKVTQQLPVFDNMPDEIPRLILNYDTFNLNVAKNRLDLFLKNTSINESTIDNINNVLLDDFKLKIGRIGFVKNFFMDGSLEDLKKLLPKEKIGTLSFKEINIRINEIKKIENYDCNNIEILDTGFISKKNPDGSIEKQNGIIIVRDLNTLAEKLAENDFNKEEIKKLISSFDKESNVFILI